MLYIFITGFIIMYVYHFYTVDSGFYSYKRYYPHLQVSKNNHFNIKSEVENLSMTEWNDWPEKEIYSKQWKVFPFYGFGFWISKNCKRCPKIVSILKSIPNLKTALLSRLGPNTTLLPHQGWADLSNHILRCHYGIIVPNNCHIFVDKYKRSLRENEIVVFDDSRMHYASNNSQFDRIVLIIDLERPANIPKGISTIEHTTDLDDFIESLKQHQ